MTLLFSEFKYFLVDIGNQGFESAGNGRMERCLILCFLIESGTSLESGKTGYLLEWTTD